MSIYKTSKRKYYKIQDFVQPILTENGTLGGDSFAVACSIASINSNGIYNVFDGNNATVFQSKSTTSNPQWVTFYNPNPLNVKSLKVYQYTKEKNYYIKALTVQGSNDNSSWVDLTTWSNSSYLADFTVDLSSNSDYYLYYRIYVTSRGYYDSTYAYFMLAEIEITAQEAIESISTDYDYSTVETPQKIKDLYKSTERKYYKYGKELNAIVNGTFAKIDKGVASGFSASNYLKLPAAFNPENKTWEQMWCVTTSTNVTSRQHFHCRGNNSAATGIALALQNSAFQFLFSINGAWYSEAYGPATIKPETKYWVKMSFDGSAYKLQLSTNGIDFTDYLTYALTNTLYTDSYVDTVGNSPDGGAPWLGSIDLSQSYININGARWWSGDSYTKVGSWIDDGVVSGFTTANYLTSLKSFSPSSSSWEMKMKINMKSSANNDDYLWTSIADGYGFIFGLKVDKFIIFASSNGSSWNLVNGSNGTHNISLNTDYFVKFGWDGSEYYVEYSLDDVDYTRDITVANTTAIYQNTAKMKMGDWATYGVADRSSIDLSQSYIKINDKMWWYGTKAVETTKEDADYSLVPAKQIIAAYKTGKRKYYKYQYQDWTQPVLTANGTMGGGSFAVSATKENNPAYYAVDGDASSYWQAGSAVGHSFIFYNPNPLNVTKLVFTYYDGGYGYAIRSGILYGSNDNSEWTQIKAFTSYVTTWDVSDNTKFYKYYKIEVVSGGSDANIVDVKNLSITAKEQIGVEVNLGGEDIYEDFVQPTLSANGVMGGDTFAVRANQLDDSHPAYKAFDKSASTYWYNSASGDAEYYIYNPNPLCITNIEVKNRADGGADNEITSGAVYGSDNGNAWTELVLYTNTVNALGGTWQIPLPENKAYYKYYKIAGTHASRYVAVSEFTLTAKELKAVGGDTYDYSAVEVPQLVYNLVKSYLNAADWNAVKESANTGVWGSDGSQYSIYSGTTTDNFTFKELQPAGKWTLTFAASQQYNFRYGTFKITITYEDDTQGVVWNSNSIFPNGATAGGDYTISLTMEKKWKTISIYMATARAGENYCYGGHGKNRLTFYGNKQ